MSPVVAYDVLSSFYCIIYADSLEGSEFRLKEAFQPCFEFLVHVECKCYGGDCPVNGNGEILSGQGPEDMEATTKPPIWNPGGHL